MAKHDNWGTPKDLAHVLDSEFHFTKEVCAEKDNRCMPCLYYINSEENALKVEWGVKGDVIYCNPPYSMLTEFVHRAFHQSNYWGLTVVMLIPAYTDTKYFQECIAPHAAEVRFLKGRLKFWEDGKPGKDTARFPSAVVVFKPVLMLPHPRICFWDYKN